MCLRHQQLHAFLRILSPDLLLLLLHQHSIQGPKRWHLRFYLELLRRYIFLFLYRDMPTNELDIILVDLPLLLLLDELRTQPKLDGVSTGGPARLDDGLHGLQSVRVLLMLELPRVGGNRREVHRLVHLHFTK